MWRRKTVVLTTWSRRAPWVASWASRLAMAWRSSPAVPPPTIWPLGPMPTCPDTINQSPARTTGVYAPTGLGASLIALRSRCFAAGRSGHARSGARSWQRTLNDADGLARGPPGRRALGQPGGGGDRGEHGVGAVDR